VNAKQAALKSAALAMALLAALVLVRISGVRYSPPTAGSSVLRLSWRARGEPVQDCRRPSAEELARLPAHMRQEEICEGRTSPFQLIVRIDGAPALEDTVAASGARGDRPVYVYREMPVQPGHHSLEIEFRMLGRPRDDAVAVAEPFPREIRFEADFEAVSGRSLLVTYDEDARTLVTRGADR
jgi:hypothetical protein